MTDPRITIVFSDDNGTAAPVYRKYRSELRPQPAHLEFDPGAAGLTLTAGYNGDIGGTPARIWNEAELWFTIAPETLRAEIVSLADDADLAALLERVRAGYEYDSYGPSGHYTGDAREAIADIEERLQDLPRAEVWEARDWVDAGCDIGDAAKHETLVAYAKTFEGCEEPNQVIDGDIAAAVAAALAVRLPDDADDRNEAQQAVARLLAGYDADTYGHLIEIA